MRARLHLLSENQPLRIGARIRPTGAMNIKSNSLPSVIALTIFFAVAGSGAIALKEPVPLLKRDNGLSDSAESRGRQAVAAKLNELGLAGDGDLLDYYVARSDEEVLTVDVDYNSDSWFARPTKDVVHAMARTAADSFMHVFTRNLQDPSERSPHAMELRYVFDELDRYLNDRYNSVE